MIAAITAGGRVDAAFANEIGTGIKALAPLGGERLINRAIEAARGAGAQRIVIVGPAEVRAYCKARVDDVIDAAESGRENLLRALRCAGDNDLLLLTSDLPFIDGAAASAFVRASQGAELTMPLVAYDAYKRAYPGAPSHATAVGGERVANGSAFYFAPGTAGRVETIAQQFFDARKSLVRMAALTGPVLLLKFVLRRLTVADVEARAQRVLGVDARAIRDASPALCFDIDTLAEYRYALEAMRHA